MNKIHPLFDALLTDNIPRITWVAAGKPVLADDEKHSSVCDRQIDPGWFCTCGKVKNFPDMPATVQFTPDTVTLGRAEWEAACAKAERLEAVVSRHKRFLENNSSYVDDLHARIAAKDARIKELEKKLEDEELWVHSGKRICRDSRNDALESVLRWLDENKSVLDLRQYLRGQIGKT